MIDRLKLKKDRRIFIVIVSIVIIIGGLININFYSVFYYNTQLQSYYDKISIDGINLSNTISSNEIIGVLNSMAKRSSRLNDSVNGDIPKDEPELIKILNQIKMDYNASIVYVMNNKGDVVACTPYDGGKTLTGKNYSFRSYFSEAMKGQPQIYPAVGVTTGVRGIYYASPIYQYGINTDGTVLGVLVAKMGLEPIDIIVDGYSDPAAIVSNSGTVFASNIPAWKINISTETLLKNTDILTQIKLLPEKDQSVFQTSFLYSNKINYDGKPFSVFSTPVSLKDESGTWKLIYLHNFRSWYSYTQPWLINLFLFFLYGFMVILITAYSRKLIAEIGQKTSEEELKSVISSIDDLVFVLDKENIFINYYQPLSDSRLYASAESFLGKSIKETMPPEMVEASENAINLVKTTGCTQQYNYSLNIENSIKWYSSKISIRKNSSGHFAGVTVVVRDITNLIEIELDLKKSKNIAEAANRSKSTFLANMSHEIRTPMNAILGFTELLYSMEDNPEKKNKLGMIKTSGQNLLVLINNILDFSKIEAGKIGIENKSFSLRTILDNMYSMYKGKADDKSLEYTINIEKSVPEFVLGDEHRVIQILTNIIGNALKFTKYGSVAVDLSYDIKWAVIKVKDTGIGIKDNKLDHIFSAFSQADSSTERRFGGTGLGLAISKQLVELLGGSLTVSSRVGVGSVFVLKLPLSEVRREYEAPGTLDDPHKNLNLVEKNNEPGNIINSDHRILVAEDNKMNQVLIKAMLKQMGYECEIAENGKVSIDKLKAQHYDLLFLDIQMPVMDGLETIKYIRKDNELKNIYVIALTANALVGDSNKYIEAGCNDYISKPIDREVLKNKLTELFGNKL